MKKTLRIAALFVLVITIGLFALTGCSSTPYYKYLNTNWDKTKKETATYSYSYTKNGQEELTGVLTTSIYPVLEKNNDFSIGGKTFSDAVGGNIYEYKLEVSNGDYLIGKVYFKSESVRVFMPVASYTERLENSVKSTTLIEYDGNTCKATVQTGDGAVNTFTGELQKNGQVFDNVSLHAIARTLNFSQSGTLSFQTPICPEGEFYVRNVAMGVTTSVTFNKAAEEGKEPDTTFSFINDGKEFGAKVLVLTINDKPAGIAQTIYVANSTYTAGGEDAFTQPVVKIVEGNNEKGKSTYTLTSIVKVEI